jgi:[ribosomal protein S18]-alanine N-acetyltransferase
LSSSAQTTIRFAGASDVLSIIDLQRQAQTAAQWTVAEYERMLSASNNVVLVAEMEGNVCGFLAASGTGIEWELENIVTDNSLRRRGIARGLMQSLFEHARGVGGLKLFLQVREDNTAAKGLYESAGFRRCGHRPGYYGSTGAVLYVFDFI